jgi:sugar lactone lactonase YvrE
MKRGYRQIAVSIIFFLSFLVFSFTSMKNCFAGDAGSDADLGADISVSTDVNVAVNVPSLNVVNTIVGTGSAGYGGDGGPAVAAMIDRPIDLAVDHQGNLLIADVGNDTVRKVDSTGVITTIAGNGSSGYSGDGGPATQAQIDPECLAADSQGNIYIGNYSRSGSAIRKVDTAGNISTLFNIRARAMVLDADDHLFVLTTSQVSRIAPDGTQSVVAGTGSSGYSGDGGAAIEAQLSSPVDIAIDRYGNLFIAESSGGRVRRVDTNGIITTYAGGGDSENDGVPALEADVELLSSIAVDPGGNLYILSGKTVRKVDRQGLITTVNSEDITVPANSIGDGGAFEQSYLECPRNLHIDKRGALYIAEYSHDASNAHECSRVRKAAPPSSFPVLFTAPADGMTCFFPEVEVSGTVRSGARVFVNDIEAAVNGDVFHVTVQLNEGENRILARAEYGGEYIGTDALKL